MKKQGIINSNIATVLSKMGHTDTIVICDCGLPIPEGIERIDLAYTKGKPSFLDILDAVIDDFQFETVILANEIKANNTQILDGILKRTRTCPIEFVDHESFKKLTKNAKAIIRTGENTPYANIILKSGVVF